MCIRDSFIDYVGIQSFQENWDKIRREFSADSTLPKDVAFEDVELVIGQIVDSVSYTHLTLPTSDLV